MKLILKPKLRIPLGVLILKPKLRNSVRGIDIEIEIEQFHSVILTLKPKSWIPNGDIDIETETEEYDFHYRTSNGTLKTSIAHACLEPVTTTMAAWQPHLGEREGLEPLGSALEECRGQVK